MENLITCCGRTGTLIKAPDGIQSQAFTEAVILLVEHSAVGAKGVCLGRRMHAIPDESSGIPPSTNLSVKRFHGGPVGAQGTSACANLICFTFPGWHHAHHHACRQDKAGARCCCQTLTCLNSSGGNVAVSTSAPCIEKLTPSGWPSHNSRSHHRSYWPWHTGRLLLCNVMQPRVKLALQTTTQSRQEPAGNWMVAHGTGYQSIPGMQWRRGLVLNL